MNIFDDNLVKQVQNFSTELPDNDWEVLLAKMEAKQPKRIVLWRRYAAAASIALLLGAGGLIVWYGNTDNNTFIAEQVNHKIEKISIPNKEINSSDNKTKPNITPHKNSKKQKIRFVVDSTNIQKAEEIAFIKINEKQKTANNNRQISIEEAEKLLKAQNAENRQKPATAEKNRSQYYASLLASSAEIPVNMPANTRNTPDMNGIVRSMSYQSVIAASTYTDSQYDLPVSFGLQIGIHVVDKLYINTGLQYTLLHSKFSTFERTEAESLLKSTDNQYLHYLGIPVMFSYRFFDKNVVKIYASAGGSVEKGLVKQNKVKNMDKDALPQADTHEKIEGVQFSLNANVGVSVRVFSRINLFVEPSFAWYIPATKYIQPTSSRTKNPLFANLNAGVRFDIK